VSRRAAGLKGAALVAATLEAVRLIGQGVDIAASDPRWAFLVYNGSVAYWHAAAALQRDGARAHLLPSQERMCQALERAGDAAAPPEWRARHLVSLALCQADAGRADEAGRALGRAQELANRLRLDSRVRRVGGWLGGGALALSRQATNKNSSISNHAR
jgi:hypothetical protein